MRLFLFFSIALSLSSCNISSEPVTIDGILEVPENRNRPHSRKLKLAYKILKAKNVDSTKAPLVFLQGGAGGATLIMEEFWKNHPFRSDRDIVLMDQRGTGESEANCTEIGKAMFAILGKDLDQIEATKALDSIFSECKRTMKKDGVDLAGYNSKENAADFEDLRKALGYKKWNLYGVSYGSRLGLTIMRDFPNSVRSAIFTGVFAPENQLFGSLVLNFENSLFEVLKRCEQNEACNSRYPDLNNRLLKILDRLQSKPLHLIYDSKPMVLNRQDALLLLQLSLYSRYSIAYIPATIEALEKGNSEPIDNALKSVEFIYNLVNWPMNNSLAAYEELPFFDKSSMYNILEKSHIGFDVTNFEGVSSLSEWHPYRASAIENQPVVSEIPTLMVSGILDPVTPPINASEALKHLKNGYEVIFQDESHDVANSCFFKIAQDFLNKPYQKPNADCTSLKKPIKWILSSTTQ